MRIRYDAGTGTFAVIAEGGLRRIAASGVAAGMIETFSADYPICNRLWRCSLSDEHALSLGSSINR
jgi:hypothetical protein